MAGFEKDHRENSRRKREWQMRRYRKLNLSLASSVSPWSITKLPCLSKVMVAESACDRTVMASGTGEAKEATYRAHKVLGKCEHPPEGSGDSLKIFLS